jgi:hypothetical protein
MTASRTTGHAASSLTLALVTLLALAALTYSACAAEYRCSPTNCIGCCTTDNRCLPGRDDEACGTEGFQCGSCGGAAVCIEGSCRVP